MGHRYRTIQHGSPLETQQRPLRVAGIPWAGQAPPRPQIPAVQPSNRARSLQTEQANGAAAPGETPMGPQRYELIASPSDSVSEGT
jgi:hypothetical protein